MIIDEQSVLSAYDDKCTLLQAINKMNVNINALGDKIISNDMVFADAFDPNVEPYSTGTFKENSLYFNYSKGILYQYQFITGTPGKTHDWVQIFKFAKAD